MTAGRDHLVSICRPPPGQSSANCESKSSSRQIRRDTCLTGPIDLREKSRRPLPEPLAQRATLSGSRQRISRGRRRAFGKRRPWAGFEAPLHDQIPPCPNRTAGCDQETTWRRGRKECMSPGPGMRLSLCKRCHAISRRWLGVASDWTDAVWWFGACHRPLPR